MLATKKGLVKKTPLKDYDSPRSAGVIAINLREDDELIAAELCSAEDDLLLVSKQAQAIRFTATDESLRPMGRATSGVIGMKFREDDELLSMSVVKPGHLRVHRDRPAATASAPTWPSTRCAAAPASA